MELQHISIAVMGDPAVSYSVQEGVRALDRVTRGLFLCY